MRGTLRRGWKGGCDRIAYHQWLPADITGNTLGRNGADKYLLQTAYHTAAYCHALGLCQAAQYASSIATVSGAA